MYKKHINGTINPMLMFVAPIFPIKTGATAPPTMVKMSIEDAVFVFSPNPRSPNAKMDGNMMDMKK